MQSNKSPELFTSVEIPVVQRSHYILCNIYVCRPKCILNIIIFQNTIVEKARVANGRVKNIMNSLNLFAFIMPIYSCQYSVKIIIYNGMILSI